MRTCVLAALAVLGACRAAPAHESRPWLDGALDAGRWLEHVALPTDVGLAWPAVQEEGATAERSLYAGAPGVVLFFLELAAAAGDERWLALARAGADELAARLPDRVEGEAAGLYTGVAGVGFVLGETWRRTGDERYRRSLEASVDALVASAQRREDLPGAAWSATNDVVSGTAGIGFFLLWAADELGREDLRRLAGEAGARLFAVGEPLGRGLDWPMDPEFPRRMPNFSHGTAGVAAFLARLPETLPAARLGAEHLLALADRSDGLRIYHDAPDGLDLYYYGWCHGPCGTARLFRALAVATGEERWSGLEADCARAVLASGLPEQRLPGFWNNVSRCCGSAGVIEFFVDLHERDHDPERLAFARRVGRDLLARGSRDEHGLSWPQAEHRVRPELVQAQTGLMQGAAGIGLALLCLDAAEHGVARRLRLPDEY